MQAPSSASGAEPASPNAPARPATRLRASARPRAPRPPMGGILATLIALGVASVLALLQSPHPDMFRPLGRWDMTKLDWWGWPLERNAFRRSVVRGNLQDVFVLPASRELWVVGEGGLILHSMDGGKSWEQQRPKPEAPTLPKTSSWSLISSAHAEVQREDPKAAAEREWQQQKQQQQTVQAPIESKAPDAAPKPPAPPAQNNRATSVTSPAPASAPVARPEPPPTPPTHATLRRVQFIDARRGWAVGDAGSILASENGGRDWAVQTSGTRNALKSVHFLPGGLVGWAVGDDGTILRTQDGGRAWSAQKSGTRASLNAVHVLADGQTGWVGGGGGTLLFTRDGGQNWQPGSVASRLPVGEVRDIRGLRDGRRVVAVGANGAVLQSQNGGETWTQQLTGRIEADENSNDARPTLERIALSPDETQVWASAGDGRILISRGGGAQWQTALTSERRTDLNGIAVGESGEGWAVGDGGALLHSDDGGESWTGLAAGVRATILDASFLADGRRGWAVGPAGSILATRDGGDTWVVQDSGTRDGLMSIQMQADGRRGWIAGDDGLILMTEDGGDSWQRQKTDTRATLRALHFLPNGRNGWVGGDSGTLLSSTDGGRSWHEVPSGMEVKTTLTRVLFSDDGQRGWLLSGGLFMGRGSTPNVLLSADGGRSWRGVSGASGILAGLALAGDGRRAWAVGIPGVLLSSRDGGESWSPEKIDGKPWLLDVHASADGQRVWVAGSDGTLLATRNGGSSWAPQQTGTRNWLRHVSFDADGETGRALGAYGTVLTTRNGGNEWTATATYRRYLAPWYFLVLTIGFVVLGFQLRQAWRRASAPAASDLQAARAALAAEQGEDATDLADHGVAVALASDQPVRLLAGDRLGYTAAVEALRDFLRNEATEPRITMAISGPWGSGKSSLMRMLQSELECVGFRTAWFNAWHHQQEGRPLAALFNTIRRQSVPPLFRRPLPALRVRSRLIWGRGPFYKLVCVGIPVIVLLALGDMTHEPGAGDRLLQWVKHHLLQMNRTVLTDKSIQQLRPAVPRTAQLTAAIAQSAPPAPTEAVRREVFDYMERALVWQSADKSLDSRGQCADPRAISEEQRCVFDRPEQLLSTVEKHSGVVKLWPSEKRAILKAAEKLDPPSLFPGMEHFLLPLLGVLALLFTKGISVYGLQLLKPLQALLISADKSDGSGKEPTGSIEHYRREFALLADALDGRLVIFVDDLDRCDPATVNSVMEMTNYLVDVGRCFIVLGMAMDHVKACIQPRTAVASQEAYATEYLRKLVHIELPVPPADPAATLNLLGEGPPSAAPAPPVTPKHWTERALGSARAVCACTLPHLRMPVGAALLAAAVSGTIWLGISLNELRQAPPLPIPVPTTTQSTAGGALAASGPVAAPDDDGAARALPKPATPQVDVGVNQPEPFRLSWPWLALAAVLLGLLAMSPRILRERLTLALGGALRTQDSDHFRAALVLWHQAVRLYDATPRGIKRFFNRARLFAMYEQQDMERQLAQGQRVEDIDEAHVVALAAIHHVAPALLARLPAIVADADGGNWAQAAARKLAEEENTGKPGSIATQDIGALFEAMQAHQDRFGIPGREAIARFILRVQRIQVR